MVLAIRPYSEKACPRAEGRPSWVVVGRAESQPKPVPLIPGEDVKMDVRDFLHGRFAIGQEEVYLS
jgi:hypothetical protein